MRRLHAIEFADADARRRRLERERAESEKGDPIRSVVSALRGCAEVAGRVENAMALVNSRTRGADQLLAQALLAARADLSAALERLEEAESARR